MAQRKKKLKTRQAERAHMEPGETPEDPFEEVVTYLEQKEPQKALEVLERLPRNLQRQGQFFYLRGHTQMTAGNFDHAVVDLETAARMSPQVAQIFLSLAMTYAQLEYWQHAGQAVEKFLKKNPAYAEGEELARTIQAEAREVMEEKARLAGIPLDKFQQANLPNERAQLLLAQGEYKRALRETEYATRAAPGWAAPRNNRALLLYYQGQLDRAIAEEVHVLEKIAAGNIQALGNLILFHTCLWQREQAERYGERLKDVLRAHSFEVLDIEKAIEGLSILEDDESLWEFARRFIDDPLETLSGVSWYVLGAAAANTGHIPEAKRLLERAKEQGPEYEAWIEPALKAVKKAARSKKPPVGSCLTGRFPYMHFRQFWPYHIGQELLEGPSQNADEDAFDKFLEKYVARYPYVAFAGKQMLWCEAEEQIRGLGLALLAASGMPAAYEEMRRFGTSQYGSDPERMKALTRLQEEGQLAPNELVRFWSAKDEMWKEIHIRLNRIEEDYLPPCSPQARNLVDQAGRTYGADRENQKSLAKAVELLRKAVQTDPGCAIALHNLGAMLMLQEQSEEGETFLRRAVEVDPNYLFGYTSLAEMEFGKENYEACKNYLERIFSAPTIPANAMLRALAIQARTALVQDELEGAKSSLEMMRSIAPNYPEIEAIEGMIRLREIGQTWQERWFETRRTYRNRQLNKPISADEGLAASLDRVSREALVGTLRFWDAPTAGRKAEVIAGLSGILLDQEFLEWKIPQNLSDEERQALAWVLESGGVQPWEEFTKRYGDDFDESPYWHYHEAKTVPGRLRMAGLLAVGTLDGQRVALIPNELRSRLRKVLEKAASGHE